MPELFAATWALKSERLSLRFLVPELPSNFPGALRISVMPSSWKRPSFTSLKATIIAPSSSSLLERGGIDPGAMPPMSAWWPRPDRKKGETTQTNINDGQRIKSCNVTNFNHQKTLEDASLLDLQATKKIIFPLWKHGVITVMSGRWLPPAKCGWLDTRTSPSFIPSLPSLCQYSTWNFTADCIAPRWTGMWGALATRPPSRVKRAQEKSRRSYFVTFRRKWQHVRFYSW